MLGTTQQTVTAFELSSERLSNTSLCYVTTVALWLQLGLAGKRKRAQSYVNGLRMLDELARRLTVQACIRPDI